MDGKEVSPTDISVKSKRVNKRAAQQPAQIEIIEKIPSHEDYLNTLTPTLAKIIRDGGKITKAHLEKEEFTSILRVGGVKDDTGTLLFPKVADALKEFLSLRGLPVKLHLKNKQRLVELHKHQVSGIKHMITKEQAFEKQDSYGLCGSILKLEMGLGKTLLAITGSLISPRNPCTEAFGERGFPTLVLASKTVLLEWKTEGFEKFFGSAVKVLYYHKSHMTAKQYASITREDIVKYDFVVTSYDVVCSAAREGRDWEAGIEMGDPHTLMAGKIQSIHCRTRAQTDDPCITGHRILFYTPWERVIADESQRFANPKTFTYKALMAVYGRNKLCLTGTPIKNSSLDVWAQLRWCGYTGVTRAVEWKRGGLYMMKEHKLNRYILSLDTKDTEIKLPDKIIIETTKSFKDTEKQAYDYVLGVTRSVYDDMMNRMATFASVLALFTRLRQLCIAPYLITSESKREKLTGVDRDNDTIAKEQLKTLYKGPLSTWIHDKKGTAGIRSRKMRLIVKAVQNMPKDEKVVIFSMFTSCLDLLREALNEFIPEFRFEQMDGDTTDKERIDVLHSFKNIPEVRGILMTYKVGSEGLNLTEGNHVICIEPWWTPTVGFQSVGRCHRPGQLKDVKVYNIYINNTIENRILAICAEKNEMAKSFLEGTNHAKGGTGLDKATLGEILGR